MSPAEVRRYGTWQGADDYGKQETMCTSREREKTLLEFKRFCRLGNRRVRTSPDSTIARSSQQQGCNATGLKKGVAIAGTLLFLPGLLLPSVAMYPAGALVPVVSANPLFAGIYILLALAALVLLLLDDPVLPAVIGTTLGIYIVIIDVPAALNGSPGAGLYIMALGDLLLIAGCLFPG
jgi:hypothetical protein